jgi:hypothetical protein
MKFWNLFATVTVGIVVAFVSSSTSHATLVKALNIKQLAALSNKIVKAEVIKKDVVDDSEESRAIVNCYTLQVEDWIKGSAAEVGNEIVIKQLADGTTQIGGRTLKQNFGFPSYLIGKSYLFFLPRPNEKTGLSAPIGLQQGVFEIKKDESGNETVVGLQGRIGILKKDLVATDRKTRFTVAGLENLRTNQSYDRFKAVIQQSLED